MDIYSFVDNISLTIGLVANVAIARLSFLAYGRLKLKSLFLVAISASIGALCVVLTIFCMNPNSSELMYRVSWWFAIILGMIDILLYAFGLSWLIKHLLGGARVGSELPASDTE